MSKPSAVNVGIEQSVRGPSAEGVTRRYRKPVGLEKESKRMVERAISLSPGPAGDRRVKESESKVIVRVKKGGDSLRQKFKFGELTLSS